MDTRYNIIISLEKENTIDAEKILCQHTHTHTHSESYTTKTRGCLERRERERERERSKGHLSQSRSSSSSLPNRGLGGGLDDVSAVTSLAA